MMRNIYLVYDVKKVEFVTCFDGYLTGKKYAGNIKYEIINRTHPMHKNLLADLAKSSPELRLILQEDEVAKKREKRLKIKKLIHELKELTDLDDVCKEWKQND